MLFNLASDPLLDKIRDVLVGQRHAVLEQDLQAIELVLVAGKEKRAEVSIHAHADHLLLSVRFFFGCDQLRSSIKL